MNEPNPETAPGEATALSSYKDRSTGLTFFGVLTILLGCLAGLFILLMLVGQAAAARSPNAPPTTLSAILPAVLIYGVLAVALVWLGIGSIMARRWARALLLIFSWGWLIMGLCAVMGMAFIMPKILAGAAGGPDKNHAVSAAAIAGVMAVMFVIFGVIFVILPAIWIFFYHSRHVKATCEARDPVTRWTDACPLPVLALCLWLLLAVPMLLLMPIVGHGVVPFFGTFLTGLPGSLLCLAIAALWAYAAWLLYKLDVRGWWLILIAMVVFMVSAVITYARHDIIEMYQLMGYPQAQIDQIQKTGLLTGNRMAWLTTFSMVPILGYILFVKKYLRGKA
ncbi:MAG: hypothetical protein WBN22_02535 [Verrucomicrobiia bacterium]